MKGYQRQFPLFSLCGLNCGLCTMYMGGHCPGCGGEGHRPCALLRCSAQHGALEYCFQCSQYPCERYDHFMEYDSFITHQNIQKDVALARRIGLTSYQSQLKEKMAILSTLLEHYNDGRRKTLFSTALILLELEEIRQVMARLTEQTKAAPSVKERAAAAAALLEAAAKKQGAELKLKKKPKS